MNTKFFKNLMYKHNFNNARYNFSKQIPANISQACYQVLGCGFATFQLHNSSEHPAEIPPVSRKGNCSPVRASVYI